ncbi:hypothetical protein MKQ70_13495 [Chitinophaga sedimenti]|uniref:hypothetical protein n=1 Tax=Chitinophaga sedimenti TaxID=2033606 RepID=UPI0020038180|nr:hypothetical protein [Chitinophaga sedimenti]MCK7555980.1 hypothetical protein [Chitinophaga sedimenti]
MTFTDNQMKHLSLLIILLAIVCPLQSQNLSYESLDAYSKAISSFQMGADKLSYTERGTQYEFGFTESSFRITFYNQLATEAYYKSFEGRDVLTLTEGIDLSKVRGITWEEFSEGVILVRLHFVKGFKVNTRLIENGREKSVVVRESVDLFCKDGQLGHFSNKLYEICPDMQKAKGLISAAEIAAQRSDMRLTPAAFIQKYPASIYSMAAAQHIKRNEQEKMAAANRISAFIDSVANAYHFRMGMSEASFAKQNPELTAWFFKKKYRSVAYNGTEISYSLSKKQEKDITSPVGLITFKNDKLTFVYLYYRDFSDPSDRTAAYQQLVKLVKARVPASALLVEANAVTVRHPADGSSLTLNCPQEMHGKLYPIVMHLYKSDR